MLQSGRKIEVYVEYEYHCSDRVVQLIDKLYDDSAFLLKKKETIQNFQFIVI